jgi:hypothetical protein
MPNVKLPAYPAYRQAGGRQMLNKCQISKKKILALELWF